MTKNQELAILDNAITALGADTYCGPWLASVRYEVARDISSDIFPDFSIIACQRECAELKKQNQEVCKVLRDDADAYVKRMRAEALKNADDIATKTAASVKERLQEAKWAIADIIKNLP